ncbi:MAG TPA: glycoside hydrolase family 28 protein [bacterium]|nr:glycoside hydrolase family 28 protein [bacterium]
MKKILKAVPFIIVSCLFLSAAFIVDAATGSDESLPFELREPADPVFPARVCDITDFGAVPDGKTLNTAAFSRAVDKCGSEGGGVVLVPAGEWLTGPIHLKSNINLRLSEGAVVRFSADRSHYLPPVFTRWEGIECYNYSPLIYARGCDNVAVTGKGTLDGSGKGWWDWKHLQHAAVQELYDSEFNGIPVAERVYGTESQALRPQMLQLIDCRNVLLEDYTIRNSPFWTNHIVYCDGVNVRNIRIINPHNSPNTDALNIDSSRNVHIDGIFADVGDDAVCLKSGLNEDGWRVGKPTENVLVENCTVKNAHGGFVVGSDTSGGVRNVIVRNCKYDGTDIGLRFKSMRGRGGYVENVYVSNISMGTIKNDAVRLNMFYAASSAGNRSDAPPSFKNIFIKNIRCRHATNAIVIKGLPEQHIRNIGFENIGIKAVSGVSVSDGTDISMEKMRISVMSGPVYSIRDTKGFRLGALTTKSPGDLVVLEGGVSGVVLGFPKPEIAEPKIRIADGIDRTEIVIEEYSE